VVTRLAEACTEYATLRRRVLGDDGVAEREGVLQEGEVERGRESDSERSGSSSAMEVGHGGLSVGGGGRFIQSRKRGIVGGGGGGEEGTMGYWNAMEALSQSRSALQLASRMGL
jgi:hypothetical protein